jgi:hypothetical protein
VPYLDADFCRNAARELEQSEARRELPERILKTEKDWSAASFGLVSKFLLRKAEAQRYAEFTGRYQETVRRTRRLMLILAARAVELETGQRLTNPGKNTPITELPLQ